MKKLYTNQKRQIRPRTKFQYFRNEWLNFWKLFQHSGSYICKFYASKTAKYEKRTKYKAISVLKMATEVTAKLLRHKIVELPKYKINCLQKSSHIETRRTEWLQVWKVLHRRYCRDNSLRSCKLRHPGPARACCKLLPAAPAGCTLRHPGLHRHHTKMRKVSRQFPLTVWKSKLLDTSTRVKADDGTYIWAPEASRAVQLQVESWLLTALVGPDTVWLLN
jgi:hypothetical protein